jgi:hypothetical protein
VLTLTERITANPLEIKHIPSMTLIPVENAVATLCEDGSLCIQTSLEFESSMDHPTVVKAIRSLRRARKRLAQALPELTSTGEHLALIPTGWAQPISANDSKYVERLEKTPSSKNKVFFCGDTYGSDYEGDLNLTKSVVNVTESLINIFQQDQTKTHDDRSEDSRRSEVSSIDPQPDLG